MRLREFKVWFPGLDETAEDAHTMRWWGAEEAAEMALADLIRRRSPDYYHVIDGDPVTVKVQDEAGDVTTWSVSAHSSIEYSAREESA